jgi:hypothetical protein
MINSLVILAIIGFQYSQIEKSIFTLQNQCWTENYKICYFPSHCIYFENLKNPVNENYTLIAHSSSIQMKPKLYHYIDNDKYYVPSTSPISYLDEIKKHNNSIIEYYSSLEIMNEHIIYISLQNNSSNSWINLLM